MLRLLNPRPARASRQRRKQTDRWLLSLLLLAVILPPYVAFRSISLDDFDSYSFALALDHFSLDLQQPQPPGFPLYVFFGHVFLALTGEPRAALTLLSVTGGVLAVLAIHWLGRASDPGEPLAGAGAALLVGFLPLTWLTAEKALSDTPGLALTLLSLYLLWRGRNNLRWLSLGCLVSGLGLGVRPQNGLPVLLLLVGLTTRHLAVRRSLRPLLWTALPFLLGLMAWLLPTLQAVGGLSAYLNHLAAHSAHVRQADSLLGTGLSIGKALRARALAFGDTLLLHTAGISLYSGVGWNTLGRGLALALVVLPGVVLAGWRRRTTWLLAAWAALAAGQVFLLEALDRPRLMLPLLPPLALLIARGWARLRHRWPLTPLVLIAAPFVLLLQGTPLAAQLASIPAPPVQATAYVAANYPPEQTLVAAAGSFRAVQVELPAHQVVYLYEFDPTAARATTERETTRYVAIFDRDQFPDEVVVALSDDGRYAPLEDLTFARDLRVHTQHDQVRLQVLTPAERLPPEALSLPPGGCIDVGGPEDGRYLGQGWYRPEDIGGVSGRWAGSAFTTTIRLHLEPERDYLLTLRALAYPAEQEVAVYLEGEQVARVPLTQTWAEHTFVLPTSLLPTREVIVIELVHARMASPFDETDGTSPDRRPLTAAYDWICLAEER